MIMNDVAPTFPNLGMTYLEFQIYEYSSLKFDEKNINWKTEKGYQDGCFHYVAIYYKYTL